MNYKTTVNTKNSWEKDLGIHLDDQNWCDVVYNANRITRSDKSHERQFKIITKLHLTPEIHSKYDNSCSMQEMSKTTRHLISFNMVMSID